MTRILPPVAVLDFAAARCSVGLLSNGRLVTEEIIRFCADRHIRLSLSLPGLRAFPENTDGDTSVGKILSHFRHAREVGCATTVGIAVTKLNLPAACSGCAAAARCLGGCREAARVFRGSPLGADPVCENMKLLI